MSILLKIKILDPQIANMIAAGEVIERPSSVVKELLENSIDANANIIEIKVKNAGRDYILVEDNGDGMEKEDAINAFTRHATSKINTRSDLFKISTLGFRGEALPSISAVSKVTLTTSTGNNVGTSLVLLHNQIIETNTSPSKKGTTILVENLFYNTPARLKHLKSDTTELSHIVDITNRLALANPHIAFKLFHNDNLIFNTYGRNNLLEVISNVHGVNFVKDLLPVSFEDVDFEVSGYIGKNYAHRPSRKYIQILLNNRPIRLPFIYSTLQKAYQSWIPHDRFPLAFLHIKSDFQLVDINVHPSKNEVRLSKEKELAELISNNIIKTLKKDSFAPSATSPKTRNESIYEQERLTLETPLKQDSVLFEEPAIYEKEKQLDVLKHLRAVGQIHGTYIVAQSEDGFYLVDQHAAVERIQFEKLSDLYDKEIYSSPLLVPYIIELNYNEILRLKEKMEFFNELGLGVEIFGNNALRVISLPSWIKKENFHDYFNSLIEEILSGRTDFNHLRKHTISTLACHSSLRANKYLTLEAMQSVLDSLMLAKNPYNCPHGRPTMIFYSKYELEKLFKRTGF